MVEVAINMIPGNGSQPYKLGLIHIANDTTGDTVNDNYDVALIESHKGKPYGSVINGRVENFCRRDKGVMELLREALTATLGQVEACLAFAGMEKEVK